MLRDTEQGRQAVEPRSAVGSRQPYQGLVPVMSFTTVSLA